MQKQRQVLATLRCFRPTGIIDITRKVVLTHIAVTGATGAGKTSSLINPLLQQFLAYRSQSAEDKLGLLILDPKGDSVSKTLAWADEAGRRDDVVILGQGCHYELFGALRRLDQIDEFAGRLLSASSGMGEQNVYWEEARRGFMTSMLCLLLAQGLPIRFSDAVALMSQWWLSSKRESALDKQLASARALLDGGRLHEATRHRLKLAVEDVEMWYRYDQRQRENHRSSILNVVRPILHPTARQLFEGDGPVFAVEQILRGKVLLASFNAQVFPELAGLVFRLIKRDFFHHVHARGDVDPHRSRLVLLVNDEYPIDAEISDVQNFATCRSRGAGIIIATQGLSALDKRLGRDRRDSLMANFGSMFFFANRERATDEEAFLRMGYQHNSPKPPTNPGRIEVMDPTEAWFPKRIHG